MFVMTGYIKVEGFKPFKFNSVTCRSSVDNYVNTASIMLPGIAFLKCEEGNGYDKVDTGLQFKEGMKVEIWAGYNGKNKLRFKGFIRRIVYTIPLELECEGYSYQLRKKKGITKAYPKNTYLKTILNDLVRGTDIKLYKDNPSIKIEVPVQFRSVSGSEIIDWIKGSLLQTVYFKNEEMYCGLRETQTVKLKKFRLNWNTIRDNDLKFSLPRELADVNITLATHKKDGTFKKTSTSHRGDTVYKRLYIPLDDATMKRVRDQERKKLVNLGYEGSISAFAEPTVEIGMGAEIYDSRYPARTERVFIDSVDFSFGPGGGRQKLKIGNTLG